MIPTREECINLLKKYHLSDLKIQHSLLVENVAVSLSKLLNEKGILIDLNIVSRAALLHDIGVESKTPNKNHATIGAELCINENIDLNICKIIQHHIAEAILENKLDTMEKKNSFLFR